jgi:hypothetical protein
MAPGRAAAVTESISLRCLSEVSDFQSGDQLNEEVTVEQNPATVADQLDRMAFSGGTTICRKDRGSDSEACNIQHLNE